jgi:hypothetical protein
VGTKGYGGMAGIEPAVSGQKIGYSEADIAGGAGDLAQVEQPRDPTTPLGALLTGQWVARAVTVFAVMVPSSGQ